MELLNSGFPENLWLPPDIYFYIKSIEYQLNYAAYIFYYYTPTDELNYSSDSLKKEYYLVNQSFLVTNWDSNFFRYMNTLVDKWINQTNKTTESRWFQFYVVNFNPDLKKYWYPSPRTESVFQRFQKESIQNSLNITWNEMVIIKRDPWVYKNNKWRDSRLLYLEMEDYQCSAGHKMKVLVVKKQGDNHGRQFLASDDCGAFRFLDQYTGTPPKCQPKKEQKSEAPSWKKKEEPSGSPKYIWKKDGTPLSPHSQSALLANTDMGSLTEHKYKELVDLMFQFDAIEDRVQWYFKLNNQMNNYFLSKIVVEK